jgi:hypothetical protein
MPYVSSVRNYKAQQEHDPAPFLQKLSYCLHWAQSVQKIKEEQS